MAHTKIRDEQLSIGTGISGLIENPWVKQYTLMQRAPVAGTLTRLTVQQTNTGGSGTLVVKINGVAVTFAGGDFEITDETEVTDTISADGDYDVDDTILLEVTVNGSMRDLSFTLEYDR
jgi:hypothetical protein